MAARAPTSPTAYIDKSKVVPREAILSAEINACVEDQHLVQQRNILLISDTWTPTILTAPGVMTEIGRWRFVFDRCESGSTSATFKWAAFAWASTASNFRLQLQCTGLAAGTGDVTAGQTTPFWRGWHDALVYEDGTESEMVLSAMYLAGTPNIFTAGLCLRAT